MYNRKLFHLKVKCLLNLNQDQTKYGKQTNLYKSFVLEHTKWTVNLLLTNWAEWCKVVFLSNREPAFTGLSGTGMLRLLCQGLLAFFAFVLYQFFPAHLTLSLLFPLPPLLILHVLRELQDGCIFLIAVTSSRLKIGQT